jgi:peptide/nickel transport system substrate-binding protein
MNSVAEPALEAITVEKSHEKLKVLTGPRVSIHMILMNTRKAPFDNPKVRQAMAHAINRDTIK